MSDYPQVARAQAETAGAEETELRSVTKTEPPNAVGTETGFERAEAGGAEYLARVMAEIDEEVARRRAELPARIERELEELFLEHSPVAGKGGAVADALALVDSSAFIDPVVPVGSNRPGGAVIKKGLRTASLWYMGWITGQVSRFASATSRALHLLDEEVSRLRRDLDATRPSPAPVLSTTGPGAWWVPEALEALSKAKGRVLHAACGDGWLVREMLEKGIDAYGIDPRASDGVDGPAVEEDLRAEDLIDHLRAVAPDALGGVVLTGVVEGMAPGQLEELVEQVRLRLAPGARLVIHSLSPSAWVADDAPPEADLAPGRPLRPGTWRHVLSWSEVTVSSKERDYLVKALKNQMSPQASPAQQGARA